MKPPISDELRMKFEYIRLPENHYYDKISGIQKTSIDITDWLENPKEKLGERGLYLYSQKFGRGKSGIAAIVCKLLVGRGHLSQLWLEFDNIPMYLKDKTAFDGNQTMLDRAKTVDFLVINEVNFKDYTHQFVIDCLDHLIRARVGNKKTTFLTTNMSPTKIKSMKKIHTESLSSISNEAFNTCLITGEDLRVKYR